jgi:hypothetical protein
VFFHFLPSFHFSYLLKVVSNKNFHAIGMHQPEIVVHHDAVNPTQLGRPQQTIFHIAVSAESAKTDLPGGFGLFRPFFMIVIQ